jgi:hypothetical protein
VAFGVAISATAKKPTTAFNFKVFNKSN